jgi:hypothetical protein
MKMKPTTYDRSIEDDECKKTISEATLVSEKVFVPPFLSLPPSQLHLAKIFIAEKTWPWY